MAFVFRSQRKDLQVAKPESLALSIPASQQKFSPQGTLFKGLPHMRFKGSANQKQNDVSFLEAEPIHKTTSNKNNRIYRLHEFNDVQLNSQLRKCEDHSLNKAVNIQDLIRGSMKVKIPSNDQGNGKERLIRTYNPKITRKVEIVNANLLKTQQTLKEKDGSYTQGNLCIQIGDYKKAKVKLWNSMKKLSPMKDFRFNADISLKKEQLWLSANEKQQKLNVQSKILKEQSKQIVKKVINKQQKLAQQKDQQQEYQENATPGPGSYDVKVVKYAKQQFRSKKEKFRKIFYSPIERFNESQKQFQEVTLVNDSPDRMKEKSPKNNSVCCSFLSKSPKLAEVQPPQIPPPGYYETRQTLEHDIVRNILKSSNTNTFISREPREYKIYKKELPGPGAYTLDRSQTRLSEQKNKLSFCYKSHFERNLEQSYMAKREARQEKIQNQIIQISKQNRDQKRNIIHVKDTVLEDLYISEPPPFMSGTERFSQILKQPPVRLPISKESSFLKPIAKEPFNSSERREFVDKVGQGVGIGLYNPKSPEWQKKSFNILFN